MAAAIDRHLDRQGARGSVGHWGGHLPEPSHGCVLLPGPYPEPLAAFIEDIGVSEVVDSQREETGVLTWKDVIGSEKEQDYFKATLATVREEREAGKVIYPPATEVFNAFKLTELDSVKVVILGQDPYHGPSQAHGLCFSVLPGVRTPPPWSTSTRRCSGICRDLSHPVTVSWNPGQPRGYCCSIRY